jgi:prophage regulatory protein
MKILNYDDLKTLKGIPYSKVHLWRLERDGKFPKRVPLGESRHGWLDSEIDDWITARMAERDGMEAAITDTSKRPKKSTHEGFTTTESNRRGYAG